MKLGLFVSPLGGSKPPFGHSRKCIGFLSSLVNAFSVSNTNDTNLEMNRRTNEANREMAKETNEMSQKQFDENMMWLREQFAKEIDFARENRDYNSIGETVKRYQDAGLNPALAAGVQQNVPSVSSVGAPSQSNFQTGYSQSGHVDPVLFDASGIDQTIGHAIDAYHQNRLIDAQAKKTEYDGQIARANAATQFFENVARIHKMYTDTSLALSQKNLNDASRQHLEKQLEQLDLELKFMRESYDENMKALQLGNKKLERETSHYDAVEDDMRIKQIIALKELDIKSALSSSEIKVNSSQMSKIMSECSLIAIEAANAQKQGYSIDEKILEQRLNNLILRTVEGDNAALAALKRKSKVLQGIHTASSYLMDTVFGPLLKSLRF